MRGPFSDRLLRKREILLQTLVKPDEHQNRGYEANASPHLAQKQVSRHSNLTRTVHRSVKTLLKLGFTYSQILEGSGVSDSFLRQTFHELSLEVRHEEPLKHINEEPSFFQDPDPLSTNGKRGIYVSSSRDTASQSVEKSKVRKIDSELRLFMLKTRLEINRLRSFAKRSEIVEQLRQDPTKHAVQEMKQKITSNLEAFFDELESTNNHGSRDEPHSQLFEESEGVASDSDRPLDHSQKRAGFQDTSSIETDSATFGRDETDQKTHISQVCTSERQLFFDRILTSSLPNHMCLISAR